MWLQGNLRRIPCVRWLMSRPKLRPSLLQPDAHNAIQCFSINPFLQSAASGLLLVDAYASHKLENLITTSSVNMRYWQ